MEKNLTKENLMIQLDALTQILEDIDEIKDRLGRVDDVLDDERLDSRHPPGAYSHLERAMYLIGIVESELLFDFDNPEGE